MCSKSVKPPMLFDAASRREYGTVAFLLAGSEVLRALGGTKRAPTRGPSAKPPNNWRSQENPWSARNFAGRLCGADAYDRSAEAVISAAMKRVKSLMSWRTEAFSSAAM
jgi:hypothetical protein